MPTLPDIGSNDGRAVAEQHTRPDQQGAQIVHPLQERTREGFRQPPTAPVMIAEDIPDGARIEPTQAEMQAVWDAVDLTADTLRRAPLDQPTQAEMQAVLDGLGLTSDTLHRAPLDHPTSAEIDAELAEAGLTANVIPVVPSTRQYTQADMDAVLAATGMTVPELLGHPTSAEIEAMLVEAGVNPDVIPEGEAQYSEADMHEALAAAGMTTDDLRQEATSLDNDSNNLDPVTRKEYNALKKTNACLQKQTNY